MVIASINLGFKDHSSDKVYHATVLPEGEGFHLRVRYGRRGGTLTEQCKTSVPVTREKALAELGKLEREKRAKGYADLDSAGAPQLPYAGSDLAGRVSGVRVQLLNPVDDAELERLLDDDAFWCQEKFDGERRAIESDAEGLRGVNRRGLTVGLPSGIHATLSAALAQRGRCVLDGEQVGNSLYVFDLLEMDGFDLRPRRLNERLANLAELLRGVGEGVVLADTYITSESKRAKLAAVRAAGGEGVVFKRVDAPYTPERPNTGGPALKYKLTQSATCVVIGKHATKRSVQLAVLDEQGAHVEVGSVTVPPNQSIPDVGAFCEVRYLYVKSKALFQPVLLRVRDDVAEPDRLSTLKRMAA